MYLRMSNNTSNQLDGKKQTSVSHSSTESEVVSLDAGLRMDGIPAFDLWDVVIEVLPSSNKKNSSSKEVSGKRSGLKEAANMTRMLKSCQITTNAASSQCQARLYIFEDNEGVIKMIIKGRCPMMRHFSQNPQASR